MTDFEGFIAGGDSDEPAFVARPDDIACLLFTSGTTGTSRNFIVPGRRGPTRRAHDERRNAFRRAGTVG